MTTHTLKLANDRVRATAHAWIDKAPDGTLVRFDQDPKRNLEQNAKMWAMLADVSNQIEHNGSKHTPETWKLLFMHSLGHQSRFESGLDGEVFPVGFRSSNLSVKEMSELIEWIYAWGAQNGVTWSERGLSYEA